MKRLDKNFFEREALTVAKELLGKVLVRRIAEPRKETRNDAEMKQLKPVGGDTEPLKETRNDAEMEQWKPVRGDIKVDGPNQVIIMGQITETEAYIGVEDKACHARHGKTKRNEVMWGKAGVAYVYLCMGLHNLLNVVTGGEGVPETVLIRRITPIGRDYQKIPALENQKFGPGNLTKYLQIDRTMNGVNITESDLLYIVDMGQEVLDNEIEALPRIGIDYAGEYKKKLWRFKINR